MDFWFLYLKIWYWLYLVIIPLVIFSAKPQSSKCLKSVRLLISLFLLPALSFPLRHARFQILGSIHPYENECWGYAFYFLFLAALIGIVYTGWWELMWRFIYKQVPWKIRESFQHRFLSDVIVFISGFVTLNFVLMVLGYRYNVYMMFDILATFKHIIPLLC